MLSSKGRRDDVTLLENFIFPPQNFGLLTCILLWNDVKENLVEINAGVIP